MKLSQILTSDYLRTNINMLGNNLLFKILQELAVKVKYIIILNPCKAVGLFLVQCIFSFFLLCARSLYKYILILFVTTVLCKY